MENAYSAPSSLEVGMKGCCPRCGNGKLFKGFLNVAPECEACGLDLAFADSGDGPAVFTIGLIRPLKGWLVAQQFRHKAAEGRLES